MMAIFRFSDRPETVAPTNELHGNPAERVVWRHGDGREVTLLLNLMEFRRGRIVYDERRSATATHVEPEKR